MRYSFFFIFLLLLTSCSDDTTQKKQNTNIKKDINNSFEDEKIKEKTCSKNFEDELLNPILSKCVDCHKDTGVAIKSGAKFKLYENDLNNNIKSFKSYASSNSNLLLSKAIGENHQGGKMIDFDSNEYKTLSSWIESISVESCTDDGVKSVSVYYSGTTLLSYAQTYKKASILLTGDNSSEFKLNSINSKEVLEDELYKLMSRKGFEEFLMRNANDKLLVKKYLNENTQASEVLGSYHYPRMDYLLEVEIKNQADASSAYATAQLGTNQDEIALKKELLDKASADLTRVFNETQKALVNGPLKLIVDVVTRDKPYGEILTSDYMMLNPYSASAYGSSLSFKDIKDADDYKRGYIEDYMFYEDYSNNDKPVKLSDKGYTHLPIAGILTSPIFLARYPSTATNKNRARSRAVSKLFLGFDIESLAIRSMDSDELKKVTNPGDSSTSCYACHKVMDPVAGAFYNWGDNGYFKDNLGIDSLPDTYKDEDKNYHSGDVWYRENIKAGFEDKLMPTIKEYSEVSGYDDGVIWLAKQIVEDERFAKASVMFWFKAIFGSELSSRPTVSSDDDYSKKLQIYNQEQLELDKLAEVFKNTNQNLKKTFVAMLMSERFRVKSVDESSSKELLEKVGVGRLLTPEELDKKVYALTGYRWSAFYDKNISSLLDSYYMFYGGIDSDGVDKRVDELTALMSAVVSRMANEIACPIAIKELDSDQRVLFSDIDPRLEPISAQNNLSIKKEIQNLHKKLLNEDLDLDDVEIESTFHLFYDVWNMRKSFNQQGLDDGSLKHYSDYLYAEKQYDENLSYEEFCFTDTTRFKDDVWDSIDWDADKDSPNSPYNKLGVFYNPKQTMRAWIAVLTYMFNDYRFIVE